MKKKLIFNLATTLLLTTSISFASSGQGNGGKVVRCPGNSELETLAFQRAKYEYNIETVKTVDVGMCQLNSNSTKSCGTLN